MITSKEIESIILKLPNNHHYKVNSLVNSTKHSKKINTNLPQTFPDNGKGDNSSKFIL